MGFCYKTCLVSNSDFFKDMMEEFDILLIFTKGEPPMIVKSDTQTEKSVKPKSLKDKIHRLYTGNKIELHFEDNNLQRWEYF